MPYSSYFGSTAKLIVVVFDIEERKLIELKSYFFQMKMLNVLVVGKFKNVFKIFSYNPFSRRAFYGINQNATKKLSIGRAFPDKLRNLAGYTYKAVFYPDPETTFKDGQVQSTAMTFMKIAAEFQKARVIPVKYETEIDQKIGSAIASGTVDVCLNCAAYRNNVNTNFFIQGVPTYEVDRFCAFIPYPDTRSHLDFLLKPFDSWTWVCFLVSMISCCFVWQLLNTTSKAERNSWAFFLFGFISCFLGQLVPFRKVRSMQTFILQLMILLTFVLNCLYDSLIISSITNFYYGTKITTIDEMLRGNYSYLANRVFEFRSNESDHYKRMEANIKFTTYFSFDFKNLSSSNVVLIEKCSFFAPDTESSENLQEFYYILEEKFQTFYAELFTAYPSFFVQRLREISLKVFESSIKTAWIETKPYVSRKLMKEREYYENEEYFLKLPDLTLVFYLLLIGLFLSSVIFLAELFWGRWKRWLRITVGKF